MRFSAVFLLLLAFPAFADELQQSRALQQEARTALQAKQYDVFLAKIRAASDLRPSHPTLLYQLAGGLTLNGKLEEALDVLERLAAMGMVYAPEKQADFAPLQALPRFATITARFAKNGGAIGSAARTIELHRKGMIHEGLAHDAKGKRFFVSSVRNREILAVDAKGNVTTFAKELPWGVFGMAVDAKRNVLWATTSTIGQTSGVTERDKAALVKLDLRSGKVLATIPAPSDDRKHLFGDVVPGRNGEVLVSDSSAPAIYRLAGGKLESVIAGEPFTNLQGVAVIGERMYVSDYSKGLFVVERGTAKLVKVPATVTLLGVDGLYAAGANTLIATQNGTNPNRILRIRLDGDGVAEVTTLAAGLPRMLDPTLGVIANKRFWFNANAQWDEIGEDGKPRDESKLEEAVILGIDL